MPYPIDIKEKAIHLRKSGYSLKEIAQKLDIAKSTASMWLDNILIPPSAQKRLQKRKILGQYKTVLIRKKLREELLILR